MYTHIGNGIVLKTKDVIGVFDIKTLRASRENKKVLYDIEKLEKEKAKVDSDNLENNSVILLESNDGDNKYELSQIAVNTLKKRLEKVIFN